MVDVNVRRYLVVDDHEEFRGEILRWLEQKCPGVVVECGDGCSAVTAYEEFRPDWVFMDIEMPKMDGISATRSIRTQFPDAHIIILTQHDSPELRASALETGACAFVSKEDLSQLCKVMERYSKSE